MNKNEPIEPERPAVSGAVTGYANAGQEPSVERREDRGAERSGEGLVKPRKRQHCRLCGQRIAPGEPCKSWSGVEAGEGWWRSYAHPECYAQTEKEKWDYGDWECCLPGDMDRPAVAGAEPVADVIAGESQRGARSHTDKL